MYNKFGQFINGKWLKSSSGETYEVFNPANEETIGNASKANKEDIDQALLSAQKGFEVWKNTSPWERSKIIRNISEIIRKYIEVRFNCLALEATTDEIMMTLRNQISDELTIDLNNILQIADLAKFAKSKPSEKENTNSMILAIKFVNQTKIEQENE